MKKFLIVIVVLFALMGLGFGAMFLKEYNEAKQIDRTPVDMSKVKDGVYEGYSETTLVKAQVRVTVKDGKIENVEILKHECGKGRPAEAITKEMIEKNDIEVDTVSGATISSEVIKDAVRKALRNE